MYTVTSEAECVSTLSYCPRTFDRICSRYELQHLATLRQEIHMLIWVPVLEFRGLGYYKSCSSFRLSRWGKKRDWGCPRIGCLGRYCDATAMNLHNHELCGTPHEIVFGWSNEESWDGWGMWLAWGRGEAHRGFWWGNLKERTTWKT